MKRKIVAIGGGENGQLADGTICPYELEKMDREIIRLTEKKSPNFLFMAHSVPFNIEPIYYEKIKDVYKNKYGCDCKILLSTDLSDEEKVKSLIDWADIIYEGGGNTLDMIELWRKTGFNKILRKAWEDGKVMCGVSAGANCWFKECSSDSLKIKFGPNQPLIIMECLGFVDGVFVPHCDEPGRGESIKNLLKDKDSIALQMSNCTALEIVDDKYRLITSDASYHGINAYGLKSYWKNGKYVEERIDDSPEFKALSQLLNI